MPGSPFYSEPFDMDGNTRLRVEALLLPDPSLPPAHATLHVQGTDDGKAEMKTWVCDGSSIDLSPETMLSREFHGMRGTVRVMVDPLTPLETDRVKVRLTRLP